MLAKASSAARVPNERLGLLVAEVVIPKTDICSARVERCVPLRMQRSLSEVNQRSTWLSHDVDVGVKCPCKRGRTASQRLMEPERYSAGLKGQMLVECEAPNAPVAKMALSHRINANIVHARRMLGKRLGNTGW